MSEIFASLNDLPIEALTIYVPRIGVWFADVDMTDESTNLSGAATIRVGGATFVGTIDPDRNGVFGLQRHARVIGGAAGWRKEIPSRAYHNDALVRASEVIADAAREAGETLGTITLTNRLGADYVRNAGTAGRAIDDATHGEIWYVGYNGVTQVGARASVAISSDAFELLSHDPKLRRIELGVDDPKAILIGDTLSDQRLETTITISSLEIHVRATGIRIVAFYGYEKDPLLDAFESAVERTTDRQLLGHFRYRVVSMSVDRVNAQAVRKAAGLPDLIACSMWPGVAGAHAELTPGAEILVEFIEGDRAQPMITHFAGKDGMGHIPVELQLCGSAMRAARQGDLVQSGGPALIANFWPVPPGVPAPPNAAMVCGLPYFVSFTPVPIADQATGQDCMPLFGVVSTGSPKVKMDSA